MAFFPGDFTASIVTLSFVWRAFDFAVLSLYIPTSEILDAGATWQTH